MGGATVSLIDRLRVRQCLGDDGLRQDAATALEEALAIARELARLARCMDAPPERSIGTQVALLEDLERRVGIRE